ncbi:hypothetical protein ABN220_09125 [Proteus cibi]|uniref:hypothetical protein n=1 Tax=Proteus cibi TaxID=2050966 RepID=UPI0032DB78E7
MNGIINFGEFPKKIVFSAKKDIFERRNVTFAKNIEDISNTTAKPSFIKKIINKMEKFSTLFMISQTGRMGISNRKDDVSSNNVNIYNKTLAKLKDKRNEALKKLETTVSINNNLDNKIESSDKFDAYLNLKNEIAVECHKLEYFMTLIENENSSFKDRYSFFNYLTELQRAESFCRASNNVDDDDLANVFKNILEERLGRVKIKDVKKIFNEVVIKYKNETQFKSREEKTLENFSSNKDKEKFLSKINFLVSLSEYNPSILRAISSPIISEESESIMDEDSSDIIPKQLQNIMHTILNEEYNDYKITFSPRKVKDTWIVKYMNKFYKSEKKISVKSIGGNTDSAKRESIGGNTDSAKRESIGGNTDSEKEMAARSIEKNTNSGKEIAVESIGVNTDSAKRESIGGNTDSAKRESIGVNTDSAKRESIGGNTDSAKRESIGGNTDSTKRQSIGVNTDSAKRQSIGINTDSEKEIITPSMSVNKDDNGNAENINYENINDDTESVYSIDANSIISSQFEEIEDLDNILKELSVELDNQNTSNYSVLSNAIKNILNELSTLSDIVTKSLESPLAEEGKLLIPLEDMNNFSDLIYSIQSKIDLIKPEYSSELSRVNSLYSKVQQSANDISSGFEEIISTIKSSNDHNAIKTEIKTLLTLAFNKINTSKVYLKKEMLDVATALIDELIKESKSGIMSDLSEVKTDENKLSNNNDIAPE